MPLLPQISSALRVEDTCDHCRRAFARSRGLAAVCLICGYINPRNDSGPPLHPSIAAAESAMLAPAAETAVLNVSKPRRRAGSGRRK